MNHTSGQHYLTIISDSAFDNHIVLDDNESAYHSFLVFANKKPTTCTISAQLRGKKTLANIHIISFVCNQLPLHVDGNITIPQTGDQATGKLLEEVIILGEYSHTLTKPVLDIKNNNVSASHGARIHRIDETKLFYLRSRGLSESQAKEVVIAGMIHSLFESNPIISVVDDNTCIHITNMDQYKDALVKQIVSNK
ncbi:MAG: SufD family Fe-S cluster assembly protein [Candidatus Absconditabacterales bacterium]